MSGVTACVTVTIRPAGLRPGTSGDLAAIALLALLALLFVARVQSLNDRYEREFEENGKPLPISRQIRYGKALRR